MKSVDDQASRSVVPLPAADRLACGGIEIGLDAPSIGIRRLDFIDAVVELHLMDLVTLSFQLGDNLSRAHLATDGNIPGCVVAGALG